MGARTIPRHRLAGPRERAPESRLCAALAALDMISFTYMRSEADLTLYVCNFAGIVAVVFALWFA